MEPGLLLTLPLSFALAPVRLGDLSEGTLRSRACVGDGGFHVIGYGFPAVSGGARGDTASLRELPHRRDDGLEVTLLWNEHTVATPALAATSSAHAR